MYIVKKYIKKIKNNYICIDFNYSTKNTIIVCGTGRSGTTWLGDVISSLTGCRIIFEPFVLDKNLNFAFVSSKNASIHDMYKNLSLYLPLESKSNRYHEQLECIVKGRVSSLWTDQEARIGVFSKRVIKGIRCNLLLGYINVFWPEIPIVLLIRNPIDVIRSMLKMSAIDWSFGFDPYHILSQKELVHDHLSPFKEQIMAIRGSIELLAHRWAIENYVALRLIQEKANVLVVQYEKLLTSDEEWKRIAEFLNPFGWRQEKFDKFVHRPSYTTRDDQSSTICNLDDKYNFDEVQSIVYMYGLEKYIE